MKGRPRKPPELHVLEGTFREDRHGDTPKASGQPVKPTHLKPEASAFWDANVPALVSKGIAGEQDAAALTVMCEWWARYRKFSAALDKAGPDNKRIMTLTRITAEAIKNFDKFACRFGLTPADRARLKVDNKPAVGVAARKRA